MTIFSEVEVRNGQVKCPASAAGASAGSSCSTSNWSCGSTALPKKNITFFTDFRRRSATMSTNALAPSMRYSSLQQGALRTSTRHEIEHDLPSGKTPHTDVRRRRRRRRRRCNVGRVLVLSTSIAHNLFEEENKSRKCALFHASVLGSGGLL